MIVQDVVRAEVTKLVSLRPVVLTCAVTVLATGALSAVHARTAPTTGVQPLREVMVYALPYGAIGFIVLGGLAGGSEYATGQIRLSLGAVPARRTFLAAKTLATLALAVVTSVLTTACAAAAGQAAADNPSGPIPVRELMGAAGYSVLLTLLALAATMLARSAVLPIVALIALSQSVSKLLAQAPDPIGQAACFLPDLAGRVLFTESAASQYLTVLAGGLVLLAWVVIALMAALIGLERRDA